MKSIVYKPQGVCSSEIRIEIDSDNIVRKVTFTGGCSGNTQGVARLVVGLTPQQIIEKLQNIDCKNRGTSCPDQLSRALKSHLSL